ncbi:hypothetical protein MBLNU459_g2446t1 [Dothideomycetes sp. NU459]
MRLSSILGLVALLQPLAVLSAPLSPAGPVSNLVARDSTAERRDDGSELCRFCKRGPDGTIIQESKREANRIGEGKREANRIGVSPLVGLPTSDGSEDE